MIAPLLSIGCLSIDGGRGRIYAFFLPPVCHVEEMSYDVSR
jgi:hypothetical protein